VIVSSVVAASQSATLMAGFDLVVLITAVCAPGTVVTGAAFLASVISVPPVLSLASAKT
jgi:hypothetical protein